MRELIPAYMGWVFQVLGTIILLIAAYILLKTKSKIERIRKERNNISADLDKIYKDSLE